MVNDNASLECSAQRIKLNGSVANARAATVKQKMLDKNEGGRAIAPVPELSVPEASDTTLVAALALVLGESVNCTLVGAIVVLGRTMPLGPNTTVVPSTTAVVFWFDDPDPIA